MTEHDSTVREIQILETPEDIQNRREQVLGRYMAFKDATRQRRMLLEDARRYMYFKRDADELESWIHEKLQTASDESYKDPTNLQAKIQKHQAFEAEISAHENTLSNLDQTGQEMINDEHFNSQIIKERLEELHRLWALLLRKLEEKGQRLKQALRLIQFLRDCEKMMFWINDKESFVNQNEYGQDLEHVEVLQKKFDEFQKDLASHEERVHELNQLADKLVDEDKHPEEQTIRTKQAEVNEAWEKLKLLASRREKSLFGAHEIQNFNRDAQETMAWMIEKDSLLSTDDYGRDLPSVQALQRKHDTLDRDLAALEERVKSMRDEADRLTRIHPDQADDIKQKQEEIEGNWEKLRKKAAERRANLESSYLLHRFLSDYRDLDSWIHDTKAVINADEMAKDVAGAEALLEKHQEHKGEIDAREDSFKSTAEAGRRLLETHHPAEEEVKEKLVALATEKNSLLALWESKRNMYEMCMDLQLFYRDTEQADAWMAKQEAFLANDDLGDSLDSVEALIKKHEDFEKSLVAQEEKIKALDDFAVKLIDGNHYAADDIRRRRDALLQRRNHLHEKALERRRLLEESYKNQMFERDCDETKIWINEKLKAASDEGYLDPTNLQGKLQKHENFERELNANQARIEAVTKSGEKLIAENHYNQEHIKRRLDDIVGLWERLWQQCDKKGQKLREANDQQQYNRNIDDISGWLAEIESQIGSEDYGKDLTAVQNLQKKHALLEADVSARQERVEGVNQAAEQFLEANHFDAPNIKSKQAQLLLRYKALQEPMAARRLKLRDALRLQQFFRDVEDEEDWIREKEPIAGSTNRGRDLIGVQNLIKKHHALVTEINGHDGRIVAVCGQGEKMVKDGHFAADDITRKIKLLKDRWDGLKEKASKRKEDLDDSLQAQQYFADANEADNWKKEKSTDCDSALIPLLCVHG